jgi:DNA repair protein RadD
MKLRTYQREAIDATYDYWQNGGGNGIIVVPTGGGKSLIQAQLIKELHDNWSTRVLVLTHVKELIQQNHDELKAIWQDAPAGIYSAGLKRREIQADILFAGIQSIDKHAHKLEPAPEIVFIDECHLVPANTNTRYRRTLATLKMMYPHLKVVGLSATPYRLDSGSLYGKSGSIFDDVIYDVDMLHLIDNGWLSPVISKAGQAKIDTAGMKHTAGEFNQKELQSKAMDVTAKAVLEIQQYGADRKKWLIFASGIDHAYQIKEYLQEQSEVVTGDTPISERENIVNEFKRGDIKALINVGVFTTGFNVRDVDLIAIMRATESASLYVQMVGRGMRVFPGKDNCLLLDFGGNVARHGCVDAVQIKEPNKSDGEGIAPAKECPECYSIIHAGIRECPDCGFIFPPPEISIAAQAASEAVLSNQIQPKIFNVQKTEYHVHKKSGRPDSVKVTYQCGLNFISEWIFPQAKNTYYYKQWCAKAGIHNYPTTAQDFVDNYAPQFEKIQVVKDGKYWKVKRRKLHTM